MLKSIKCDYCEKYISNYDIVNRAAKYYFSPSFNIDLPPENSSWICEKCLKDDEENKKSGKIESI